MRSCVNVVSIMGLGAGKGAGSSMGAGMGVGAESGASQRFRLLASMFSELSSVLSKRLACEVFLSLVASNEV